LGFLPALSDLHGPFFFDFKLEEQKVARRVAFKKYQEYDSV
jgi:hypothetical protein